MNKLPLLLIILSCAFFISACNSQENAERQHDNQPKTYYGQSVKQAKDLSSESSNRNKEIEAQANSAFDE